MSAAAEEIGEKILSAGEAAPAPAVPEPPEVPEIPEAREAPQPPPAAAPAAPTAEKLLDTLAAAEEEPQAEDLSATRRVNINELKFGPNYRSEAD